MTNNELAWKIFEELNAEGAELGSASDGIIEDVLDRETSWVPVGERLPDVVIKNGVRFTPAILVRFVYVDDNDIELILSAYFDYGPKRWLEAYNDEEPELKGWEATHWQPLPAPPAS